MKPEGEKALSCDECKLTFRFEITLKKHNDIVHKDTLAVKCELCDEKLSSLLSLQFHYSQIHQLFQKVRKKCNVELKSFTCSLCEKLYATPESLKNHYRTKHTDQRYTCAICGKSVKCISDHMRMKHGPPLAKSKCTKCDYVARPGNLKQHIRAVHTNSLNKTCPFCGEIFKYINEHLKETNCGRDPTEFNQKVSCTQCGKMLMNETQLRRHVKRIHNQIRDQQCTQCEYNTYSAGNLRLHVNKQHLGKTMEKVPCPHCLKPIGHLALERHIKIYHVDA
jgi:KRAB domain-containing zinc finger protein